MSAYDTHGVGLNVREAPLPRSPTAAEPGSPEKIAVLCERALAGQCLHHPQDVRLDLDAIAFTIRPLRLDMLPEFRDLPRRYYLTRNRFLREC